MASDVRNTLDRTDWAILDLLQRDGRMSFLAVGRQVNLSAPAVRERVRRMEQAGVIRGYGAVVDPAAAGRPVLAFVRMSCIGARCIRTAYRAEDFPEILEIHRVSGDGCSIVKVVTASVGHLETLIDRLAAFGKPETSLVLSTALDHGPVRP